MAAGSSSLMGITFSGAEEADDDGAPSWRNGLHADWELQLGDRTFPVHKVIIARGSKVLSASVSGVYADSGSTDLTQLLPEVLHSSFEDVLDYLYDHNIGATVSPLLLFATADILGMRSLFDQALGHIQEQIHLHVGRFFCELVQLPPSDHAARIKSELIREAASNFGNYVADGQLFQVPEHVLHSILTSDSMRVNSEDEIVDFLLAYDVLHDERAAMTSSSPDTISCSAPAEDTKGGKAGLGVQAAGIHWQACRLAFVSLERLLRLRSVLVARADGGALLHLVDSASFYKHILEKASALCEGPYRDFVMSYKSIGSLSPRRPMHIPLAADNEIDFVVHIPEDGVLNGTPSVDSDQKTIGDMMVSVRVFPVGTHITGGAFVSIFAVVAPAVPSGEDNWAITAQYEISVLSWKSPGVVENKRDVHTFDPVHSDRGWHDFVSRRDLNSICDMHWFLFVRVKVARLDSDDA